MMLEAVDYPIRSEMATRLFQAGCTITMVSQSCSLSEKQARHLAEKLTYQGFVINHDNRITKRSDSILTTRYRLIQSSLAVSGYLFFAGKQSKQHFVYPSALLDGYAWYSLLYQNVFAKSMMISMADLWLLIRDLHQGHVIWQQCILCHAHYVYSMNQRIKSDCPFCFPRHKKNNRFYSNYLPA